MDKDARKPMQEDQVLRQSLDSTVLVPSPGSELFLSFSGEDAAHRYSTTEKEIIPHNFESSGDRVVLIDEQMEDEEPILREDPILIVQLDHRVESLKSTSDGSISTQYPFLPMSGEAASQSETPKLISTNEPNSLDDGAPLRKVVRKPTNHLPLPSTSGLPAVVLRGLKNAGFPISHIDQFYKNNVPLDPGSDDPMKRRRGRPRKYFFPFSPTSFCPSADFSGVNHLKPEDDTPPRKRGRPRKADADSATKPVIKKKPRGRPRGSGGLSLSRTSTASASRVSSSTFSPLSCANDSLCTPPIKRPGRGRPRKFDDFILSDEISPSEPKKRGRPRKSEPRVKRYSCRGRPRKSAPVVSSLGEIDFEDLASRVLQKKGSSPKKIDVTDSDEPARDPSQLSPRPKRRKPLGMHKNLRDLYVLPVSGPVPDSLLENSAKIDYDPLHLIRCHSKDNTDTENSEIKVWRCLFEPNPLHPQESTHAVASCGGERVCLTNCETGQVLSAFQFADEEFYTIAWTTVALEGNTKANILAAAGRLREIRLLRRDQLVCYAELKGHADDITAMLFHQTRPTILFSGDSKASVFVWDIGVPSLPDYATEHQLLLRLRCPRQDVDPVLNLVFLPFYSYLIAGCEDGLFAWKMTNLCPQLVELHPDMELKLEVDRDICIDGLAQLSDNALVIKVVESGEILVFDFADVLERRKGLQSVVPIEIRGHLSWKKTDEIYINVSARQNLGAVLCGDNDGSIWIYDLDPYLDSLHSSNREKFFVKPLKTLGWPDCSVQGIRIEDKTSKQSRNPVVNSVDLSSDGHFLASVTDNNLVCIWRYSPPAAPIPSPKTTPKVPMLLPATSPFLLNGANIAGLPQGTSYKVVPVYASSDSSNPLLKDKSLTFTDSKFASVPSISN